MSHFIILLCLIILLLPVIQNVRNLINPGNYYKDTCLVAAGGRSNGVLDFYQVHSYDGAYGYNPFNVILELIFKIFLTKPVHYIHNWF